MREGSHFMTGWPSTIGFAEFTPQRPPLFQYQVAPKKAYTTQVRGNCSSDSNQHALPFSPSLALWNDRVIDLLYSSWCVCLAPTPRNKELDCRRKSFWSAYLRPSLAINDVLIPLESMATKRTKFRASSSKNAKRTHFCAGKDVVTQIPPSCTTAVRVDKRVLTITGNFFCYQNVFYILAPSRVVIMFDKETPSDRIIRQWQELLLRGMRVRDFSS